MKDSPKIISHCYTMMYKREWMSFETFKTTSNDHNRRVRIIEFSIVVQVTFFNTLLVEILN